MKFGGKPVFLSPCKVDVIVHCILIILIANLSLLLDTLISLGWHG